MRERVGKMLGKTRKERRGARGLTVSTFHSFGLGVLQREREAVGGTFTIFDQGDQTSLVKQLLRAAGADRAYDAQAVLARISNAKNAFQCAEELPEREGDAYDEITKVVYPRYQAALRQYKAFDFDDLVCEVARLWERDEDARALAEQLPARPRRRVPGHQPRAARDAAPALRGDAATSARWATTTRPSTAGAAPTCATSSTSRGTSRARASSSSSRTTARRCRSSRSPTPSSRSAPTRSGARCSSPTGPTGDKVQLVVAGTPEVEATWVGREIRRMVRDEGKRARDVAVLYRSNGQSRLVEEALREQGVAHRVVGGTQFFERKEVKDVLAYMKLALNPSDEISLRRIINYPARGIGETSLEKLALHAATRQWSLWQAVERVDALDDVPGPARDGCQALGDVVAEARASSSARRRPPSEVARAIVERVGLQAEIDAARRRSTRRASAGRTSRASSRRWRGARRATARGPTGCRRSCTRSRWTSRAEGEDAGDVVTLSTLHGSKGLEFDVVFLIGCEEGYLPHARTLDARATDDAASGGAADIEEERRLFYVGVTRARERLVLSRARSRVLRGKAVPAHAEPLPARRPGGAARGERREGRGADDDAGGRGERRGHPRDARGVAVASDVAAGGGDAMATILVLESDAAERAFALHALEQAGHPAWAPDGETAVEGRPGAAPTPWSPSSTRPSRRASSARADPRRRPARRRVALRDDAPRAR